MPIYEYACSECGAHVELLQKVGAAAPESCANCGASDTMGKKVSQTSFQLKGGGWYSDLYSSPGKSTGASSESKPSSESELSPEPAAKESKPTPKSE